MSAYLKPLPLPYRVELRPVMLADYLSERILLVSCLPDMLFP